MKKQFQQPAPLFRLAVAMVAGIVVARLTACPLWLSLLLLTVVVAAALFCRRHAIIQSVLIVVGFAQLGMASWQLSSRRQDEHKAPVTIWFLQQREHLLARYRQAAGTDDDLYGVLAAMTLGDKRALTPELRQTYSITGASHVLALSGMHLGVIYLLLTTLTLRRRRWWVAQALVVIGIWAFAFLTGLSPSVTRSATMISCYALFSLGGRGRSTVNALSLTAIILLLADARSLYDVGFQMSFLAVFSILLFMPLFGAIVPRNYLLSHPLLKWVCGMTAVSLSAQLGVAPLIAYYFHRFSTWFLLTNFVAIPLATLILYAALLMLLLPCCAPLLLWLVRALNASLGWMSRWPLASIDGLQFAAWQVVFIYVAIGCFYFMMQRLLFVRPSSGGL